MIGPHPNAAPGFLEQAYQVNSDFYDIALYHAHDGTRDYKRFTQRLRDMLAEKKLKKPFANTETGYRSYQNQPELFYNQARILVQKLAYSVPSAWSSTSGSCCRTTGTNTSTPTTLSAS